MQDYPTNDKDRKSLLYWMEQGLCCNIVTSVDPQLSQDIGESRQQFDLKLNQRDLLQGRARRIRAESVEKTARLASDTRAFWSHTKMAISMLELDPEIADFMGIPEQTSRTPADRAEFWISAVDTLLRGRDQAEALGLPEFALVPYDSLEQQRQTLHGLNTRYNSVRNELFLASEAVKLERERVDRLIRKLTANLRYLLSDRSELEIRQIMRRYGFSFRGEAPRANPDPTAEPDIEDSTGFPGDEPLDNSPDMDEDPDMDDQEPAEPDEEGDEPGFEPHNDDPATNDGRDTVHPPASDPPASDDGEDDTIAPQPRL